jgi:hypothetical protein
MPEDDAQQTDGEDQQGKDRKQQIIQGCVKLPAFSHGDISGLASVDAHVLYMV